MRPIARLDRAETIVTLDCDLFIDHPAARWEVPAVTTRSRRLHAAAERRRVHAAQLTATVTAHRRSAVRRGQIARVPRAQRTADRRAYVERATTRRCCERWRCGTARSVVIARNGGSSIAPRSACAQLPRQEELPVVLAQRTPCRCSGCRVCGDTRRRPPRDRPGRRRFPSA